ncbi:MAG: hypothetical protein ACRDOB_16530 [Streptosporangiaceae bacterium]
MTGSAQLSPERLARLLDEAVGQVTPAPGTLDRIRHGVRRRRWLRRAGAALLSVAVLGGGGVTALAVAPGGGPAGLGALGSSAPTSMAGTSMAGAATAVLGAGGAASPGAGSRRPSGGIAAAPQPGALAAGGPAGSSSAGAQPRLGLSAPQDKPKAVTSAMDSDDVTDTGGIGRLATATIVARGPAQTTGSFLLVVSLTTGATQSIPFTATSAQDMPPSGPVVIGWANASGTGSREIFVQVSRGCCTASWAIFRLVNGHLTQVSLAGRPALLTVGGGAASGGGFSCPGLDLVVYGYQARGTGTFLAAEDTYRWSGAKLVLASHRQTVIYGSAKNPQLASYQEVSCGGLDPALGGL